MRINGDFHVHTPYCPHGTDDSMESYVRKALEKGLTNLTFTEHAPLPRRFTDPTPDQDSAMRWSDVTDYIEEGKRLKDKYKNEITIRVGFEVDFISDFEQETKAFLDRYGADIDDSILSVHMLKAPNGEYVCIDFSEDEFNRIITLFGSVDTVYKHYYETVKQAIGADLGFYKPMRIGHITLVEKFSKLFQPQQNYDQQIIELLQLVKKNNLSLDINTAGNYKEYCGTSYPRTPLIHAAHDLGIPLVVGSDSHKSDHIGRGFELLPSEITYSLPLAKTLS
ncbi:histidinol-phosphatase HisJ [Aquibacillus sp. 3ASR75-54]|uniref:Histidinol-phosphatase n=2 Tax=Aquibacillus salsiterrae TaxID=2950439 RepID=A0A9X4AFQ8_9BACI|nr:histidinol-phosphatase HisJ [Aquibacillus salsiterrae]MDC3416273.1 histidinol-phosphatase HisJ [Aquibacillus salsiterrae]